MPYDMISDIIINTGIIIWFIFNGMLTYFVVKAQLTYIDRFRKNYTIGLTFILVSSSIYIVFLFWLNSTREIINLVTVIVAIGMIISVIFTVLGLDGLDDYFESQLFGEFDPLAQLSPALTPEQRADEDKDGLIFLVENRLGTDPHLADTDGDGLSDGDEVKTYGCDPNKTDTDSDELSDHEEVSKYNTNPLLADTDEDALPDGKEIHDFGTNPNESDTDKDGIPDSVELEAGTDPLDPHLESISVPEFPVQIWILIGFLLIGMRKKRRSSKV